VAHNLAQGLYRKRVIERLLSLVHIMILPLQACYMCVEDVMVNLKTSVL
jgi:hypothetical protein